MDIGHCLSIDFFFFLKQILGEGKGNAVMELMGENTNSYNPETQCSYRFKVTPGKYAIVPSCVEPGKEKCFLIRLFSSCAVGDVTELPRSHKIMATEMQTQVSHQGENFKLGNMFIL